MDMNHEENAGQREAPDSTADSDLPPLEDAALPEEQPWIDSPSEEAEAAVLSLEARALDGGVIEAAPSEPPASSSNEVPAGTSRRSNGDDEGASDTARLKDESGATGFVSSRFRKGDWEHEFSAHKIAVELRRIECEVRQILEDRDPKRKRKYSGTRRWLELEEDILSLRFTGRVDENTLRFLLQQIARRNYLFRQLRYVASTRPTWNT